MLDRFRNRRGLIEIIGAVAAVLLLVTAGIVLSYFYGLFYMHFFLVALLVAIFAAFMAGTLLAIFPKSGGFDPVKNFRAEFIYDKSPFAISFWERDVSLIDVNDGFMEMFGQTDKEAILREFPKLYTPKFQPCGALSTAYVQENTDRAVRQGSHKFSLMHQDKEGNPIPCEIVSVSASHGKKNFVIAYARDLREETKLAQLLEEANDRIRLMLDATPLACFLLDKNFSAIDCNMETVGMFGLADKAACIETFDSVISRCAACTQAERNCEMNGQQCRFVEHLRRALNTGRANFEWLFRSPGTSGGIPCEINCLRLEYKGDFLLAAYITDLRAAKELDEERRKLEIAEESSKAKGRFLASMSHEIRTPLNAILGITEFQLQNTGLSRDMKQAFEKIYISGDMLLGIINDILDLSKIEAGKMELSVEKYEILSMVHDTVVLNLVRIESKDVRFELDIDEKMPSYLLGDELRIKQIINNILSNAFKYTERGSVKMKVTCGPLRESGDADLLITVEDTGQGMSKEDADRLFDSYTRFNAAQNRAVEGTGLGMSITRNLLNLMGGSIFVQSELGRGSLFTIRLPQKIAGPETVGPEASRNMARIMAGERAATKRTQIKYEPMPYGRVLIVDDVEMNIYVAKGLMSPYRLKIDSADSGYAAIEKIEAGNAYDIVFMDHMMPKMDGIETTARIRKMGYAGTIVALTANAIAGQADRFLNSGLDDFMSKPIDIRQLDQILTKHVRSKRPPVSAPRAAEALESAPAFAGEAAPDFLKSREFLEMAYKEIASNYADFEPSLRRAIEAGNLKDAEFIAHSFKGVTGLVGEIELARLCGEAEGHFRRGAVPEDTVRELYAETRRVLEKAEGYGRLLS